MNTDDTDPFIETLEQHQAAVEAGDATKADRLAMAAMVQAMEHADEHPSDWLQMMEQVREHEARGDWRAAEQGLLAVLTKVEGENEPLNVWKAHTDLASLYRVTGDAGRELQHDRLALEAARAAGMRPTLAASLWSLAYSELAAGNPDAAIALTTEGIELTEAEPLFRLELARNLIARALCRRSLGDLAQAEQDLAAAEPILAPMLGAKALSGYALAYASLLETRALIHTSRNEPHEAADLFGQAIEMRRSAAVNSWADPPRMWRGLASALVRYAECLRAAGRDDEAGAAQQEREAILDQLGPHRPPA